MTLGLLKAALNLPHNDYKKIAIWRGRAVW